MVKNVGVLALQGGYESHIKLLQSISEPLNILKVKHEDDLICVDYLIVPGGESTVISKLIKSTDLIDPISEYIKSGKPIWGTCAGLILLSNKIINDAEAILNFNAIDISVERNGYGSQSQSFESDINVSSFDSNYHAVFVRAPIIVDYSDSVEILANVVSPVDDRISPVLCKQANVLVSSFHPELTNDSRIHELFLSIR